jgi:hypothetical protein
MASRTRSTMVLVSPSSTSHDRAGELAAQVGTAEQAVRWILERLLANQSVFDDPELLRLASRFCGSGAELGEVLQQARADLPGFAAAAGPPGEGAATVHRLVS